MNATTAAKARTQKFTIPLGPDTQAELTVPVPLEPEQWMALGGVLETMRPASLNGRAAHAGDNLFARADGG